MTEKEYFKQLAPDVNPVTIIKRVTQDLSQWYQRIYPETSMEEKVLESEQYRPYLRGSIDTHIQVVRGPIVSKVVFGRAPFWTVT